MFFGKISLLAQVPSEFSEQCSKNLQNGEYSSALTSINKALEIDSLNANYLLLKATSYYYLGKYDDAVKYCYATLKIDPEKIPAFFLRGQICLVTGSYGGSAFFFRKVIDFSKDEKMRCKAYINRAKVNIKLGKFNEANSDLIEANEITKDSLEVLLLLSETYYKLNQYDEAFVLLEKIQLLHPNCGDTYKMMGEIAFTKQDFAKSLSYYNKYLEVNTKDAYVLNIVSEIYYKNKDYNNALTYIYKAIHLESTESNFYKTLALIDLEKGENEEVCNNLFHAFQLGYLEKYGYDILDLYVKHCESKH